MILWGLFVFPMGTKAGKEINVIIVEFQALWTPVLLPPKVGLINMKTANKLPGKRQEQGSFIHRSLFVKSLEMRRFSPLTWWSDCSVEDEETISIFLKEKLPGNQFEGSSIFDELLQAVGCSRRGIAWSLKTWVLDPTLHLLIHVGTYTCHL